jgi:glyoxylase-like metal-dependent hydrolase (beta-lactamase superfamily II)
VKQEAIIEQLTLGPHKNFIYLVGCPETRDAAVVDPAWDVPAILSSADSRNLEITKILLTHTHPDHTNGVAEISERCDAQVHVHEAETGNVALPGTTALRDGDVVEVGRVQVEILHTPGHSPGGICYRVVPKDLLTGDTLFVGRTGRTLFLGSSDQRMFESVEKLRSLPEDWVVWPGHDYGPAPTSTIGREKSENAFFRCRSLEEFIQLREEWERENG